MISVVSRMGRSLELSGILGCDHSHIVAWPGPLFPLSLSLQLKDYNSFAHPCDGESAIMASEVTHKINTCMYIKYTCIYFIHFALLQAIINSLVKCVHYVYFACYYPLEESTHFICIFSRLVDMYKHFLLVLFMLFQHQNHHIDCIFEIYMFPILLNILNIYQIQQILHIAYSKYCIQHIANITLQNRFLFFGTLGAWAALRWIPEDCEILALKRVGASYGVQVKRGSLGDFFHTLIKREGRMKCNTKILGCLIFVKSHCHSLPPGNTRHRGSSVTDGFIRLNCTSVNRHQFHRRTVQIHTVYRIRICITHYAVDDMHD